MNRKTLRFHVVSLLVMGVFDLALRYFMYTVELDMVVRYLPPMADNGYGIRLTRTIELPFVPIRKISVFSKNWEGQDDPLGYVLKNVTWDLDRNCFFADTELSESGVPIAMIPVELHRLVGFGWKFGSYRDHYQTERRRGRRRKKLPPLKITKWDFSEAEDWDTSKKGRPKEYLTILHAVVSMMAELRNNCGIAFAMLKTGGYFDVSEARSESDLSSLEKRFHDAIREYDSLTFDEQYDWGDQVQRRYPRLAGIVEAIR